MNLNIYTDPKESAVRLTLDDSQLTIHGTGPQTVHGRDDAYVLAIPDGTPDRHGGLLEVTAADRVTFSGRGIVVLEDGGESRFQFDNVILLAPVPVAPPVPIDPEVPAPPNPSDPYGVILWVYANGQHDISTTAGGCAFVEACALTLWTYTSPLWGHVRKNPGQNQCHGHAVDAIHCLAGEFNGIWDIIAGAEEPGAAPAFNYAGPPDPAIWYPGNETAAGPTAHHAQQRAKPKAKAAPRRRGL